MGDLADLSALSLADSSGSVDPNACSVVGVSASFLLEFTDDHGGRAACGARAGRTGRARRRGS
jgi:hypothetical protein